MAQCLPYPSSGGTSTDLPSSAVSGLPDPDLDLLQRLRSLKQRYPDEFTELLFELMGDDLVETFQLRTSAPTAVRIASGRPTEADWERFAGSYPNQVNLADARTLFFKLEWSEQIRQEFFDGLDLWLKSADWMRGYVMAAAKWLRNRNWTVTPRGSDGRPVVNKAKAASEAAERRQRPPTISRVISAVAKPVVAEAASTLTMAEVMVQRLNSGQPIDPAEEIHLRNYLRSHPPTKEQHA